jgi:hypothetical protein
VKSLGDWLSALRTRSRRLDRRRSERLFAAHRDPRREVYVVTRDGVQPLPHPRFRGDAPFNWGARDAGAAELASALLRATRRRPIPDAIVFELAANVVADLPRDGFVISTDEIRRWLGARERVSPSEHSATSARRQAWTAAQCWLLPFGWTVGRVADSSRDTAVEARERRAGGR